MSESLLFEPIENIEESGAVFVEADHHPDSLAAESGVWISSAGSAMLPGLSYAIKSTGNWIWLVCNSGSMVIEDKINLSTREGVILSPGMKALHLKVEEEARVIWFALEGRLAGDFMRKLGAVTNVLMKQGVLPSQIKISRYIVQAIVRVSTAQDAPSAQLQQLLWGLLASHSGQPVAMDAVVSHEIAKVIDAMRRNQYKDSFSLAQMASLSRIPVETFRKRFVSEVGMPPQSYQLYCKMERAKTLLKNGSSVRQAGIDVGMEDQYHFSKTFKNIVGISPLAYSKYTRLETR